MSDEAQWRIEDRWEIGEKGDGDQGREIRTFI